MCKITLANRLTNAVNLARLRISCKSLFRVVNDTYKINHKYLLDASAKFRNAPSMQETIMEIQQQVINTQGEMIKDLKKKVELLEEKARLSAQAIAQMALLIIEPKGATK